MLINPFELILFDLDGTLIDTPTSIEKSIASVLTKLHQQYGNSNTEIPSSKRIKNTIGMPLEEAFKGLISEFVDPDCALRLIDQAVASYKELFQTEIIPKAPKLIYPKVVESLKILKKHKFKLVVATSKITTSAEKMLKASDLISFFDEVIGADRVLHPKPHPQMALMMLSQFKCNPKNAIMVGDTTMDCLMAQQAQISSIAVTYGVHNEETLRAQKPTWIVDKFESILSILIHNEKGRLHAPTPHF